MRPTALRSATTVLLSSALLAASDIASKTEAVEVRHPSTRSASAIAARNLSETMRRRNSARLLAASDARYRGYRLFPLILGISF
jgi:hypothetical protein